MTLGKDTAPWHKGNSYNLKHGYSSHPLYSIWHAMLRRCNNTSHKHYEYYGARGIKVCDRWNDIGNFIEDMEATYKEGLQLDRIDNDGNYDPSNCKWTTRSINLKNTRRSSDVQSTIDYVTFHKRDKKWEVTYKFRFKTQEEAEDFARKNNQWRATL